MNHLQKQKSNGLRQALNGEVNVGECPLREPGRAPSVNALIRLALPCYRHHAVVVVRGEVSPAALRAWCAERLSDYKVPETIDLSTEPLPRNANGKVLKRQLREAWAAAQ
jgi:acyl-CoA synthetase (AMP-forming)/AMP-acid ligase II